MARTVSGAVLLSTVGFFLSSAFAVTADVCPPGRYLIAGNPADAIAIDGGRVSVGGGCVPVEVKKLARTRRGIRVRTRWSVCGARRMRLKAWLRTDCRTLTGMRRVAGSRREHIDAVMSQCGDGIVDPALGEMCDGGRCADGQACTPRCGCPPTASLPPVTVTTTTMLETTSTSTTTAPVTSTTVPDPVCGDRVRDEREECDGDDLGGHVCPGEGAAATRPLCTDCGLDFSDCPDPADDDEDTFATIQNRILAPRGCAVSTCHGATRQGDLDLRAGVAYLSLVGATASNPAARAAGKLRVQPGSAAASFLSAKLHGALTLAEGGRMPSIGPALSDLELQLIDMWIEAGAPPVGPVPGTPELPPLTYEPAPPLPVPPGGYQILLEGPTLLPGQEEEGCFWMRVPNDQDFLVGKWEFSLNPGTHHFAVFAYQGLNPVPPRLNVWRKDSFGCVPGSMFGNTLSGAPHAPYYSDTSPAGVARVLKGGSYIGLNAHYHNDFDVPIEIKVWTNIYPYDGPRPPHIAQTIIALEDTFRINVPPFTQVIQHGRWRNNTGAPFQIIGVAGHMHKRGLRFTAWQSDHTSQSDGTKMYESFDWAHPGGRAYDPPYVLAPGDWIAYECLHDNGVTREVKRDELGQPTTLNFGVTTDDEMCILTGAYYVD